MGIFVDPNHTFAITVKFQDVYDENGSHTGVRILKHDAVGDGVQTVICDAIGRDGDAMSHVEEETSVINHITGEPMIKVGRFCRLIILYFFRHWNCYEDEAMEIELPINDHNVGRLHYDVRKALARQWLQKTCGKYQLPGDDTDDARRVEV